MPGPKCAVIQCSNSYAVSKKLSIPITFHTFPKDEELRKEWIKRCGREHCFDTKNKYICSQHFKECDFESTRKTEIFGNIMGRSLKKNAIPSKNISDNSSKTEDFQIFSIPFSNIPEPVQYHLDNKDIKIIQILPEHVEVNTLVNNLPAQSKNKLLNDDLRKKVCRLCLEEKPIMWSLFSQLTFDDQSSVDLLQVFQQLSGETLTMIENPQLPSNICQSCTDLLISAHAFQQKYKESTEILNEYLATKVTEENIKPQIIVKNDNCGDFSENHDNRNKEVDKVREVKGKVKLHRCPICPKEFTALELRKHAWTHEALKSYLNSAPKYAKKVKFYANQRNSNVSLFNRKKIFHRCPFCNEEFTGEQFRDHIKNHRIEGNFRCNICNRIFLGVNHLNMHKLYHKQETPYKCEYCEKGFVLKKNLDFHLLKHTLIEDLPFQCEYCNKSFPNPEHLKRHKISHTNEVSYSKKYQKEMKYVKCKICQQKFKTKEDLEQHNCKLCCAKCHKIFETLDNFKAHFCKKGLNKIYKCVCEKTFSLQTAFQYHKVRCQGKQRENIKITTTLCYICGKNVVNITQHMRCHYPMKKILAKCPQCDKHFASQQTVKKHIKEVHLNIISHRCQYCSKGFKSQWNLEVHERIHVGKRTHICIICGKGFLEKSYLLKHKKVHFKQKKL